MPRCARAYSAVKPQTRHARRSQLFQILGGGRGQLDSIGPFYVIFDCKHIFFGNFSYSKHMSHIISIMMRHIFARKKACL